VIQRVYSCKLTKENKHTFVYPGLNLIGFCENDECPINYENQFFSKGFDKIFVNEVIFGNKCHRCKEKISFKNIKNVLFHDCKFSKKARIKNKNGYDVEKNSSTRSIGSNKSITYEDEEDKELWEYYYLKFKVSKR
jgi:hypothetical protein